MIAACEDRLRQTDVARDVPDDCQARKAPWRLESRIERFTLHDASHVIVRIAWQTKSVCAGRNRAIGMQVDTTCVKRASRHGLRMHVSRDKRRRNARHSLAGNLHFVANVLSTFAVAAGHNSSTEFVQSNPRRRRDGQILHCVAVGRSGRPSRADISFYASMMQARLRSFAGPVSSSSGGRRSSEAA